MENRLKSFIIFQITVCYNWCLPRQSERDPWVHVQKNVLILDISSQNSACVKWVAATAVLYPPTFYNQSAFPSLSLSSWKNCDKSLILLNIKGLNVHAKKKTRCCPTQSYCMYLDIVVRNLWWKFSCFSPFHPVKTFTFIIMHYQRRIYFSSLPFSDLTSIHHVTCKHIWHFFVYFYMLWQVYLHKGFSLLSICSDILLECFIVFVCGYYRQMWLYIFGNNYTF